MSDLVREDPPPSFRQGLAAMHAEALAKVRTEPGEWFRLIDYSSKAQGGVPQASKSVHALRRQTTGFEFRAAMGKVYVRWLGES